MDGRDSHAIADLFDRLGEAERRLPQRDPEAEAAIRSAIARQPAAPYYMAQTIVVQQQALEAAQQRIEQLEQRGNGGGLFGGLFGDDRGTQQRNQRRRDRYEDDGAQPWSNRGGGGFLAGAAQTAMGVAGGVLLGNMIGGALFGGSPAQAEEQPADDGDSGDFDAGDFGGFGD